jgi:hypothetical protein
MHQVYKQWVSHTDSGGGHISHFHDDPVPPVVRLCNSATLSEEKRADLLAQYDATNPLALRLEIYADSQNLSFILVVLILSPSVRFSSEEPYHVP